VKDNIPEMNDNTFNGNYYKFDGVVYEALGSADEALISATNNRRSYLNLTKEVEGEDAPEDALFEYSITITDPDGEDIWFSAYDPVADETVMDFDVNGATAETGNTGFWYAQSGQAFTIKIKAGWNVRFINLLSETTYVITEVTSSMDGGFVFDSIDVTAKVNNVEQTYEPEIEDEVISGTIENPNTDYTITYTNEYLGYFYVYHSSDNTVVRFPMAEEGVKVETFDIYAMTADNTLYGGYYSDYAGKSANYDSAELTYDENNKSKDEDGTPYSYSYIKTSKKGAWNGDDVYEVIGTAAVPVSGETYYLKEVPTGYLQPYTYFTYQKADNKIVSMWTLSDLDDLNYTDAAFEITDEYTKATSVVNSLSIKAANSTTTVKLTALKCFTTKGVQDGYLSYVKISDLVGSKYTVTQQWTTPDGITVYGTQKRTVDTTGNKCYKGKIESSDAPYTPAP
jgi:hypothetical protein